MDFALVEKDDEDTRAKLKKAGYTMWARLQPCPGVDSDALVAAGIAQGIAVALINFAMEFFQHVLECIARGGWFKPE